MHRFASLFALALLPGIAAASSACRYSADRNFDVPASGLAMVAFKAAAGLATAARLLMWADAAVTSFRRRGRGGGYGDVVGFQAFQEVMVIAFLAAVAAEGRLIGPSVALVVMVAVALLACLAAVSGGSGRNRRARRAAGSL